MCVGGADHGANAALVKSMLRRKGHATRWVANGCEAVEAAMQHKYDVILMVLSLALPSPFPQDCNSVNRNATILRLSTV